MGEALIGEQVARGIDVWLRREADAARTDPERATDEYQYFRDSLKLRNDDVKNKVLQKTVRQYTRFKGLMDNLNTTALRDSDQIPGKIIRHALMFASRGFRLECLLRADDQEAYEVLRFGRLAAENGATSFAILPYLQSVNGLSTYFNPDNKVDVGEIVSNSQEINIRIYLARMGIHDWFHAYPDRVQDGLEILEAPVMTSRSVQKSGLVLAASHIAVAASFRDGDLARVPVLEPKGIRTDQSQPIYPFDPEWYNSGLAMPA